ncbi:MAG TPA: hypothetical protein VK946_05115 [Methylotenera sp.]|nr:hypothetical protein [Methylotenera sp.]
MKNIFQEIIANVFNDIPNKHTVWLEAISGQDDLHALHSATQGLELALSDKALSPSVLSKIIERAKQKTTPILIKLNQQFIRFEFMDSNLENNIVAVVYAFHKQLYSCHIQQLEHFLETPNLEKIETASPLMHGAVNHAFEMLKWRSFVNFGLAPHVWLQLHKIFQVAAESNLLEQSLEAPERDSNNLSGAGTLTARLVRIYMLDSLQQANLDRQGVDLACKLLQTKLQHVEISSEFNPIKFLFYVDLEKGTGAKRIRYFTPTRTCIYWQIDDLENTINKLIADKSGLALEQQFSIEPRQIKATTEMLNAIFREWSRKEYLRQRRKEKRQKLTTTANVVHGIKDVRKRIQSHQNSKLGYGARLSADDKTLGDKTLDERLKSHTTIIDASNNASTSNDHWIIVDESNQGLGASASRELNPWISTGQLVGLVLAASAQEMVIAVIRSTRPRAHRKVHVGMELLSRHAKWVLLKPITPDMKKSGEEIIPANAHSFAGLYLPIEAGVSLNSMLLLPKIEFIPNGQYEISINGMVEKITLNDAIDSRDDWVKIIYPR